MNGLTLKDVLHQVVFSAELTPRQLAEELGISYSMLANAANPELDTFKFAARHIIPITKLTGDYRLVDFIEASVGRVAFNLPTVPENCKDLQHMTADNVKEFGDVLQVLSDALADGEIGRVDIKNIEKEIVELVQVAMQLLMAAKRVAARSATAQGVA